MTKDLILKYADVISQMEKDAAANVKSAKETFRQKQEETKLAYSKLAQIRESIEANYREFWSVAKAIFKMLFKRPENPDEIEQSLRPIIGYKDALKSVPVAEDVFNTAREDERSAEYELSKARRVQAMLNEMMTIQNS